MGITSINEPNGPGHTTMLFPVSINEPPKFEEPVISAITPDECVIGEPDFTLFVSGTGFSALSVIFFAGHDEPTTLNGDGTLSTGVKPSLWGSPVVVQCQVRNGEQLSNAVDFTFAASGTARGHAVHDTDPDDLEDEIDEAADEGDFKSMHPHRKRR